MSRKGFGSHSFLNEYIENNTVRKIMEIGIHNGDNAEKMISIAKQYFAPSDVEYYGFDTFRNEDRLSKVKRKLSQTGCKFKLYKGDSTEILPEAVDRLPIMDLIFIDGGHSYDVVKSDWENSKELIGENTGVFFHNYNYSGPKKVVQSISEEKYMVEILNPPKDYKSAYVKKQKK